MKSLLCILAVSTLIAGNISAKTYYVSTTGNNANSGLTAALPWKTITYAASTSSPVVAGDIIYVKAGNYGAEYVTFQKSGTAGSPIVFEGYKTTPGDAPNLNFKMGDALNASIMPLLDGGNRALSKIAFNLPGRSYVTLKNFQITNYGYGVNTGNASYLTLDNIITMYTGDVAASYSGRGIQFGVWGSSVSNYNTISNCIVVNSAAEGLSINGNYNKVTNCKVYCNEGVTGSAATDYYLIICGSNNTISGCYANRIGNLAHYGHGIGVKYTSQNNLFENCLSINMAEDYYARHRGAMYNTFKNCKALYGYAFAFRDGASHNTFIGCISDSAKGGIRIHDTSEDGGAQYSGRHNVFKNCIIKNAYMGVFFDEYDQVSAADSNTIANCTFDNIDYLFYCGRPNSQNKMVNCIVSNTDVLKSGSHALSFAFTYTNFYNNKFAAQPGTGNITTNPLYVNGAQQDYHLQATSPCRDAGTVFSNTNDFDGIVRPQGNSYDIGAYEYQITGTTLSANVSSTNVKCNGENNGTATVTASGGTSPYKYAWSNGQTNAMCSGLIAGTYSVTVSDATLASKVYSATITQPLANINNVVSKSHVTYYGGSDGSITIASEGGTPPYAYLWTPSNKTTPAVTGLSAGNHVVRVTDANGCVATKTVDITQPASSTLSATVSSTNVRCNGENNGTATITATGGTAPYNYVWSNGQTGTMCSGLIAGTYSVTVSDASLASRIYSVTITQPLVNINSVTAKSHVSYYGGNDGSITIASTGGTPAYTYLWTPSNKTTAIVTGLYAGNHILKVTDANGCVATRTIDIIQPAATATLSATLSSTNVKCNGQNNGAATVTATGGTAPYKYAWSNGKTTAIASGLTAGTYSVTVSDANLVSKTLAVTITQPAVNINTVVDKSNISYYGGNDGWIIIASSGGTAPYAYSWSPSNKTTATVTGMYAGNHVLKVTDANACIATRTISLTQPVPSAPVITASTHPGVIVATTNDSSTVSVEDQEEMEEEVAINIFPNPTSGPFNVVLTSAPAQVGNEVLVVVRDLLGKEFYSKVVVVSESSEVIAIDYSKSLAPGVYTVIASSNDNIYEKKLVIQ